MSVFFTKRPGAEIQHLTNEEWRKGKRPDYTVVRDSGVYFCLDEVHIAFNARAWADTGAEVLYYLSQHRKLGDDVICITQSVANVDKQFRSVAQDFTYVRNLGKEKLGMFRLPLRFVRKTYSQPPVGDLSKPMEMGIYSLDAAGLASCYDTAKGVGIHGRAGADMKERKKGIHWAWVAVGVPLVCILLCRYLPGFLAHRLAPGIVSKQEVKTNTVLNIPGQVVPVLPSATSSAVVASNPVPVTMPALMTNEVFCVGWCKANDNYTVFMSDGEQYNSSDHEIDWIKHRQVSVLGTVYRVKRVEPNYQPAVMPVPFNPVSPADETGTAPVNVVQVIPFGQHEDQPRLLVSSHRRGAGISAPAVQ
jgi:hypothetical protein